MCKSEDYINQINSNVFFQEFTFRKNIFCPPNTINKEELQFADSVVWIDDLLFVYQIKDRNEKKAGDIYDEIKWFNNKILNTAVRQIKKTVDYLCTYPEIIIQNERGYKINIADAKTYRINKLIIYDPVSSFPEEKRFQKFYNSRKVGLIHLFHTEDYIWICNYLVTPSEINEYLMFREELCSKHSKLMDKFPEQYILGHFLETSDTSIIEPRYVDNLKHFKQDHSNIELNAILELFRENAISDENIQDYLVIVKEIAKLNRSEFLEFKKRLFLIFEKCKEDDFIIPYRISYPRTGCGFVFVALSEKDSLQWKNALNNSTLAHKYDQKLEKCIGVVTFISKKEGISREIFWEYVEFPWSYNDEMEKILKDNFPFREVREKFLSRYNIK